MEWFLKAFCINERFDSVVCFFHIISSNSCKLILKSKSVKAPRSHEASSLERILLMFFLLEGKTLFRTLIRH